MGVVTSGDLSVYVSALNDDLFFLPNRGAHGVLKRIRGNG